jgi:hypothetical protein
VPFRELAVPGVSACQRCGALHGSDARFCPHCGLAFGGPRSVAGVGYAEAPTYGTPGAAAPGQAALFDPHAAAAPPTYPVPAPTAAPAPPIPAPPAEGAPTAEQPAPGAQA